MGLLTRMTTFWALRRTQPNVELSKGRFWLPPKMGGIWITADEALRLSAVWACVTVIAKALASCRWEVFAEDAEGNREMRRNTPLWRMLNVRPNPEITPFAFREAAFIQALVWGNFYAEIERDTVGRAAALWPLTPERTCLERDGFGRLQARIGNASGVDTVLPYDDIFHLHGPGIDGLCGFDMVTMAARALAHTAAAERFGAAFYHNNAQMGGLLSTENKLNQEQRDTFKALIEERSKGADKAFGLMVLDGGWKFTPMSVEPDKGQFLETRHLLIEEVCRYFGVPPHMVADLRRSTFSNIEHQGLEFVRNALIPWAERAAQEADWKLLPMRGNLKTRIDTDWLSEGDAQSKAQTDSTLVQNGLMTRNEARKRRGLNTIGPDGDKLTVQVNMTTLDKVGMEESEPAAPPADPRGDPNGEPAEPEEAAARALFGLAMRKAMTRRTRVAMELAEEVRDGAEFVARLMADEYEHARYLTHLVAEAAGNLSRGGRSYDMAPATELLKAELAKDRELLARSFEAGDVARWCDIDKRAEEIAAELARVLRS